MPTVLGTGADAELTQVYEEGRSALASAITQLIGIVRTIISYALKVVDKVVTWAGEHPLAMILLTANIFIWIS
jgi:hypothetical protein